MKSVEKIINQEIVHDIVQAITISLWAEWCACPHIGMSWWKIGHEKWERVYHPAEINMRTNHLKKTNRKLVAFLERGGLDADHRQYFQWLKVTEKLGDEYDNGDTSFFWGHISGDPEKGTATFHTYRKEDFCEETKFKPDEVCVYTSTHILTDKAKKWLTQISIRALKMLEEHEVWDIGHSTLARFIKNE